MKRKPRDRHRIFRQVWTFPSACRHCGSSAFRAVQPAPLRFHCLHCATPLGQDKAPEEVVEAWAIVEGKLVQTLPMEEMQKRACWSRSVLRRDLPAP
jgi:hypothetical protein